MSKESDDFGSGVDKAPVVKTHEQLKQEILNKYSLDNTNDFLKSISDTQLSQITDKLGDDKKLIDIFKQLLKDPNIKEMTFEKVILSIDEEKGNQDKQTVVQDKQTVVQEKQTVVQDKQTVVQEKQTVVQEKQTVVQEKQTVVQDKQTVFQNDKLSLLEKEKYLKLNEQTNKIYEQVDFTDKTKFPDFDKWGEKAREDLVKQNPELEEPENAEKLQQLSRSLVVLQNQDTIAKEYPSIASDINKLQYLSKDIKELSFFKDTPKPIDSLKSVPYALKHEIEQAKNSLIPNGQEVKVSTVGLGNGYETQIRSGDQLFVISKYETPKRYIEKNGYKILSQVPYKTDLQYEAEKTNLQKELKDQFSKLSPNTTEKTKSILTNKDTSPNNFNDLITQQKNEITQKQQEVKEIDLTENTYPIEKAVLLQTKKSDLSQDIKTIEADIKLLEEIQKIVLESEKVENQEKDRVGNYQELQKSQDETARDTLDFLDNLGLTQINQTDLEKVLSIINVTPEAYGLTRKINLNEGFKGTTQDSKVYKIEAFNLFSKLYDGIFDNPKISSSFLNGQPGDARLKQPTLKVQLQNSGIMNSGGNLVIENVLPILKAKNKPVEEPTETK